MYEKVIVYDPETRDFAMHLDGELVGFAHTYEEAEQTLDELVYELLNNRYFREYDSLHPGLETPRVARRARRVGHHR